MARFDGHVKFDARIDSTKFKDDLNSIKSVSKKAFGAIGLAAGAMVTGVSAAGIGFESAFAGVKKTVNATTQELEALKGGIRDMAKEIPTAANEIAGIAESAGQLGIKTENILEFTRVMADLGVATNLAGEEAASTLAKFANITQMPQEQFSNLGSTIVALGNNLATTEADIAEMAIRMAGAGSQAGLTEAQILAFSGALSSIGMEAQAGGSAFSMFITDMQLAVETGNSSLKDFAKVAGMSVEKFKNEFQTNAAGAILAFIKGLNDTERNGKSATAVLAEMGITEINLSRALKGASEASDVFANAVELGNTAWEENNALTKEAEQRYQTTESKLKILGNQVKDLGITAWDAFSGQFGDGIDAASDKVEELSASMENGKLKDTLGNVGVLFGSLIDVAVDLAGVALPPLISALGFVGDHFGLLAGTIGTVTAATIAYKGASAALNVVKTAAMAIDAAQTAGVSGLNIVVSLLNGNLLKETTLTTAKTVAEGAATVGTQAHAAAQTALNTALAINPIGLVVAGLVALAGVTAAVVVATKKSREEFLNMGDALDETTQKYSDAKSKAQITDEYAAKWRNLNDTIASGKLPAEELAQAEAERKECEQWFIDNYGSYISAEEQKNGIRAETIGLIQDEVKLLDEKARIEAENSALEMKRNVPDLAKEVNDIAAKNKAMEETNATLQEQNNVLLRAVNEWETWDADSHTMAENDAKRKKILDKVNESLGTNYTSMTNLEDAYDDNNKKIEDNNEKIEKNNKELKDGTDSLQSYADSCRTLIESDLGESLGTFADKYQRINQALLDINTNGKISDATMKGLKENFPDIAKQIENAEDPGAVLNGIMSDLDTKLSNAKKTAEDFGVELNGLPKDITIDVKLNVPEVPWLARGTRGAPGGPAVVNDGNGPELIESKNGTFRMVQSNGAALTWLNKGDRVYTAEQTRSMLKRIPHYASGVGNGEVTVSASTVLTGVPEILGVAASAGLSYGEGFADGITKSTPLVTKAAADLGDESVLSLKESIDSHSPAKDTEKVGVDYDAGFANGIEDGTSMVTEAASDLGEAAISALETSIDTSAIASKLSDSLTKGLKENSEKMTEKFENSVEVLDLQLDFGIINEEQYYEELGRLRDKYLSENTKEWYEATLEIHEYEKKSAKDSLEYQRDLGLITERQYYEELEKYRDKYFQEGSDEWRGFTVEISNFRKKEEEERIEDELDLLDYKYEMGEITERQYYEELEKYRDKYFQEGSDEWRDFTVKISNFRKKEEEERIKDELDLLDYKYEMGIITERQYYEELEKYRDKYFQEGSDEWRDFTLKIFNHYKDQALKAFEDVSDKQKDMQEKFSDYGSLTRTVTVQGWNEDGSDLVWEELSNFDREIDVMKGYADNINNISDRMTTGGFDAESISKFKSIFADMSVEDGASFAKLLTGATDEQFYDYVNGYFEKQSLAEQLSKDIYGDEFEEAANDAANILIKAFETAGFNLPKDFFDFGVDSAEEFSEGFLKNVWEKLQPFRDEILSGTLDVTLTTRDGSGSTTTYTSFSPTYNLYGSGETDVERIHTAQNTAMFDKFSGGY